MHRSGGDRRSDVFVVEVDLYKQQGAVSCYVAQHAHNVSLDGIAPRWTQHFDLNGWRTARLCVSMHTMGDSIELVSCDRTTQVNFPLRGDNPDAGVTEEDLFGTGEEDDE